MGPSRTPPPDPLACVGRPYLALGSLLVVASCVLAFFAPNASIVCGFAGVATFVMGYAF